MNSLNIITSRVSPPSSPTQPRFNGLSSAEADLGSDEKSQDSKADEDDAHSQAGHPTNGSFDDTHGADKEKAAASETSMLLEKSKQDDNCRARWWHAFPRKLAASIVSPIRWILATLASPGVYVMACLYDDEGNFAPFLQLKKLFGVRRGGRGEYAATAQPRPQAWGWRHRGHAHRPALSSSSSSGSSTTSGASSESEAEELNGGKGEDNKSEGSPASAEELGSGRRSIRIKLQHNSGVGQRKHRRALSAVARTKASEEDLSAQLKSPTSPIAALTRYPKTPAPPRPLIPRRQPSYLNFEVPLKQQKTLILDLDETLIHSMSKGGRMSTGHMVEVRLSTASLGVGSGAGGAAQHPILYWVNKRPFCDEFLRRVCKWFNLVIFTASVQEYADPVIDWLESERKFFSARYYRQHCTYRQGAYIKDLSSVEPDLSKVIILDNSPLSYLFHQGKCPGIRGVEPYRPWRREPVLTHPGRQCDSHPGLDQRPDGQRPDAPGAPARGPAVCPRREGTFGTARGRGRTAHGLTHKDEMLKDAKKRRRRRKALANKVAFFCKLSCVVSWHEERGASKDWAAQAGLTKDDGAERSRSFREDRWPALSQCYWTAMYRIEEASNKALHGDRG